MLSCRLSTILAGTSADLLLAVPAAVAGADGERAGAALAGRVRGLQRASSASSAAIRVGGRVRGRVHGDRGRFRIFDVRHRLMCGRGVSRCKLRHTSYIDAMVQLYAYTGGHGARGAWTVEGRRAVNLKTGIRSRVCDPLSTVVLCAAPAGTESV